MHAVAPGVLEKEPAGHSVALVASAVGTKEPAGAGVHAAPAEVIAPRAPKDPGWQGLPVHADAPLPEA